MSQKTEFAGLNIVGTYLDEDEPKINENTRIVDARLKQAHDERRAEEKAREAGDEALGRALSHEASVRAEGEQTLAKALEAESLLRAKADKALHEEIAQEAKERADTQAEHDASPAVHEALVRRITVGDISPIIGICQVATGNTSGLWYNVDAEGQPIAPNRRYFDYHPVYDAMRRVLVDDQVMVEVQPFWFKHFKPESGPFAGRPCRLIAPGQADGFKPYPAFLDRDGNVVPIYIGAFSATSEANNMAGSRPGKLPLVSLDFPTMRTRCANRNVGGVTGFGMWNIYHYSALCHLFLTENCTPDSQALYGRGHVDSTAAVVTDADNQPNWRGFTGLWGNVWEMVDGFRLDTGRRIEIFRNDGSQAYVNTGKVAPSYGTAMEFMVLNHEGEGDGWDMGDGYFPMTQNTARANGTFASGFWGGSGTAGNVLYVGGAWNHGSGAGLFCWHLHTPASGSDTTIGCRLAKS